MKITNLFLFLLFTFQYLQAKDKKVHIQDLIRSDEVIEKTYHYTGLKGEPLPIQVFMPKSIKKDSKLPCAIFFHGGGWRGGSPGQFFNISKYLASRGIVSLSAEYSRLSSEEEAKLPSDESRKRTCVIDGKSVIRWVKLNATELRIDSSKLIAGGGSAGGHISVLSMLDSKYQNPNDTQTYNTDLQAFLLWCPAFTLLSKDKRPDVNVFNNLDKKQIPPTLFLVGEHDGWKKASDALVTELQKRNVDVENWMALNGKHMFFGKEWLVTCIIKVDKFLVERGFLEGETYLKNPYPELQLVRTN